MDRRGTDPDAPDPGVRAPGQQPLACGEAVIADFANRNWPTRPAKRRFHREDAKIAKEVNEPDSSRPSPPCSVHFPHRAGRQRGNRLDLLPCFFPAYSLGALGVLAVKSLSWRLGGEKRFWYGSRPCHGGYRATSFGNDNPRL
jgi:hypothetical protein